MNNVPLNVPQNRILSLNEREIQNEGEFVLYWMVSNRRLQWNFSLDHAIQQANLLGKPLVIIEALRCDYQWASDRIHQFIVQGMKDNQSLASAEGLSYYCYVEPTKGAGKGLIHQLAQRACMVVTDYFPCFFLPAMVRKTAQKISVRMDAVDSNGLFPLQEANREFTTAASFRRHLQKTLVPFLAQVPTEQPYQHLKNKSLVSLEDIEQRWPRPDFGALLGQGGLKHLPIDHDVHPIALHGGRKAGVQRRDVFLQTKMNRYHSDRNQVDNGAASGLSPYLHFGYISVHELWCEIRRMEAWTSSKLPPKATGSRAGWWNMSAGTEALLDELITWRELGYVFCHRHLDDYDQLSSLPDWAQKTIEEHKDDPRQTTYTLQQLEDAQTHDEVWNCAQRQLRTEGVIHNYLRMLWGKKIYEWSASAEEAVQRLITLNNKYAIDGRNPNSYSGIFWIVGRFDRAWGPVRPIFGKLRYMSSDSTARKLDLKQYKKKYSATCLQHR